MDCKQARGVLPAHVDGELSVSETIAIEHHLRKCAECNALLAERVRVSTAMRKHADYFSAPGYLAKRIEAALPNPRPLKLSAKGKSLHWSLWKCGIGAAFALLVTSNIVLYRALPSQEEQFSEAVVASHVRSLMSNRTTDVLSSDQHAVKPWFSGKIDFSPPVADLSAEGFPLTGGRLDYIRNRPVAAIVYARRKHVINLYVWPTADKGEVATQFNAFHGYNLLHWHHAGMMFWVVSDLGAAELSEFSRLISGAPSSRSNSRIERPSISEQKSS